MKNPMNSYVSASDFHSINLYIHWQFFPEANLYVCIFLVMKKQKNGPQKSKFFEKLNGSTFSYLKEVQTVNLVI
jgi:hypothetical protein